MLKRDLFAVANLLVLLLFSPWMDLYCGLWITLPKSRRSSSTCDTAVSRTQHDLLGAEQGGADLARGRKQVENVFFEIYI